MLYGYILSYSLVLILMGYGVGRRFGVKEGLNKGLKRQRLIDKSYYFGHKQCPICLSTHKAYLHKAKSSSEEAMTSTEY
ncbi:hypothetical protein [Alkaliphilus metalliredigens]|uniref:hypothetical protein n=1 Tax=Alkaliphilus metalliredigens TaxID=208226 RepID=UPI0002FE75D9|nr:hypothetical protein [Alkaliphilus metalliredigens]